MTFSTRDFKAALGSFATGVTICTTTAADGVPVGVTISSFTSVSLDPPLVLFCLGRESDVAASFLGHPHFAVNVLAENQQALSNRFAFKSAEDRWDGVAYSRDDETGCPLLDGCLTHLVCHREAVLDGGDHHILLARVMRLGSMGGQPLLYLRGGYEAIRSP